MRASKSIEIHKRCLYWFKERWILGGRWNRDSRVFHSSLSLSYSFIVFLQFFLYHFLSNILIFIKERAFFLVFHKKHRKQVEAWNTILRSSLLTLVCVSGFFCLLCRKRWIVALPLNLMNSLCKKKSAGFKLQEQSNDTVAFALTINRSKVTTNVKMLRVFLLLY